MKERKAFKKTLGIVKESLTALKKDNKPKELFEGNTAYEKLQNAMILNPNIMLEKGEVCFYQRKAKAFHSKQAVTGYTGGYGGVSLRVAKGVSVHTGKTGKQAVRGTVNETYDGNLYVTNKRLILLSSKYGFNVSINDIIQFQAKSDGFILHTTKNKTHTVLTNDTQYIIQLINLMNEAYEGN